MQLTKNIFKYLENFAINEIKMDNFDKSMLSNFINYTPTINYSYISTNPISFCLGDVNTNAPIIYNLNYVTNLSDRKTVEIDVYTSSDIDVDSVTLDLCSGVNGNAVRGSIKNTNPVTGGTLTTLVFDLGNINNSRLRQYSNIRSLKLHINADDLIICGICAFNSEYIITYDELIDIVRASNAYVLDKLNLDVLPFNTTLYEAVYKLSAYYVWQRVGTTPRNTKKGFSYLKNDADELIKYYLTNGYHPHLVPYTNTVRSKNRHKAKDSMTDVLFKQHKILIDAIYDGNYISKGQDVDNYYTKEETDNLLNVKVDKVQGKGLSTKDFTGDDQEKLNSLHNYDDTEVRQLIDEKIDEEDSQRYFDELADNL